MIFFEILLFLMSILLLSLSVSGYGKLLRLKIENNFFLEILLGFVLVTLIVTVLHFFFKINLAISFTLFLFGWIFFFKKKNYNFLLIFKKKNIPYIIIVFLFIPMFLSQKYHEDFGYYHLPYALGFIEEKIILGFANIDKSYVYNSIWLNLYSLFFLDDKNFDFLTLPSFILFLSFILFSFNQVIFKKSALTSDYFLIVVLFYFILKFTRISEFGVDLPAVIYSTLAIYYFLKFFETNLLKEKKIYFFLILTFSIFSVLIKLSTLTVILLPLYILLRNFKNLNFVIFEIKLIFIFLLFSSFLIQQFIYTGCFFFPNKLTCLNVSWFNPEYLNLSEKLELINKSYSQEAKKIFTPEQYLENFNWLHFWIKSNFIELLEHLLTILIPSLIFIFFLKKKDQNSHIFKEKFFLYFFLFFSLLFWLNFSPVYRFAIHLFVTLVFILLLDFFTYKKFSKKVFVIFLTIFIFFSFSKNIIRLNKTDNIFLGIQKFDNQYILNKNSKSRFVEFFRPDVKNNSKNGWQGRLCWDIPFICSYSKLQVDKKNGYLIINKLNN